MFKYKWIGFLIVANSLFQNIGFDPRHEGFQKGQREFNIRKLTKIQFAESSGLQYQKEESFWTHNDSGGDAAIYKFNFGGDSLEANEYPLSNKDWEDISRDSKGRWFIGEFGNNNNKRKNLRIYIIDENTVDTIEFNYPDQKKFPPKDDKKDFDCEALFWYDSHLYLFSKNRGTDLVKAYRLEDKPGKQTAELLDTIRIRRMVTGADLNSEGTEFTLLTYGMLYSFQFTNPNKPFESPTRATRFTRSGQAEGVAYTDTQNLIVSNESGKIFRIFRKRN